MRIFEGPSTRGVLPFFPLFFLFCGLQEAILRYSLGREENRMNVVTTFAAPTTPIWVHVVSVLQVLLLLWFGFLILLGSWKLFRWLIKWTP